VSKVSLVGDVIDAKPTDVENGEFSGKWQFDVLVDVLAKRLQVTQFVSNL
jgi:hypothetical protein